VVGLTSSSNSHSPFEPIEMTTHGGRCWLSPHARFSPSPRPYVSRGVAAARGAGETGVHAEFGGREGGGGGRGAGGGGGSAPQTGPTGPSMWYRRCDQGSAGSCSRWWIRGRRVTPGLSVKQPRTLLRLAGHRCRTARAPTRISAPPLLLPSCAARPHGVWRDNGQVASCDTNMVASLCTGA
jgi:hypothetical protein